MHILPIFLGANNNSNYKNAGIQQKPSFGKTYEAMFQRSLKQKLQNTYTVGNMFFGLINALKGEKAVEITSEYGAGHVMGDYRRIYDALDDAFVKAYVKCDYGDKTLARKKDDASRLLSYSLRDGAITFHSPSDKEHYIRISRDKAPSGEIKVERVKKNSSEEMVFYDSREHESGLRIVTRRIGDKLWGKAETTRYKQNGEEYYFDV